MKLDLRAQGTLVVAALLTGSVANAHVVLQKWEATAGYQEYVTLAVPHGCGLSPTTEVRVKIPDGITILVPEEKAGWQTRVTKRKLDQPLRGEGGVQITEAVDEVIWTGGSLPWDRLGLFTMLARMPDTAGRVLYFRTVQKCAEGESRWIDTLPAGEPVWKIWALEHPSPFVELKAATRPQLGATMQQIAAERAARGKTGPPPR
jgi:periplasmic copper chaperone A